MSYTEILYDVSGRIATITMNRPDRLNAYTGTMGDEMRAAMRAATDDPGVRVIVLTGAGRGFCAGADMNNLTNISAKGGTAESGSSNSPPPAAKPFDADSSPDYQTTHSYFPAVPKPIIAAINGACAGLGLVYALYCDQRFASSEAKFTTAFARRGLIAEHGISYTLPRIAGLSASLDLLMSARKFDALEAQRLGVVDRVVAPEALMAEVRAYASDLADNVSPRSMAVIKRQLWAVGQQTMRQAIEVGNHEMIGSFTSEDFKEGVAHFVQKRPAAFTGR
ncbi:MAG TPA: enoyl-CoA hydratase [Burkholderiaceae bacterium]|nr:enoyl-CoA hydratase [Burkholderiaceae bacterium]